MGAGRRTTKERVLPRHATPPICARWGAVMRRERERRGWSQEMLAERTGLTQGEISSLEHGRCLPSLETAERLARGFRCKLSRWIARLERAR